MVAHVYNIPNNWKREGKDSKLEDSLISIVIIKKWPHTHTPEKIQPPNIQMSEKSQHTQKLMKTKNGKF